MSGHVLQSHLRRLAQEAQSGSHLRLGLVTSFDPATYTAKVMIQPDGVETDWLPIAISWAGNGWGMFCPPSKDDQVAVGFEGGDLESGVILGGIYSDLAVPPAQGSAAGQQGEFWLVHKTGSLVKLANDGSVTTQTDANTWVKVAPGGAITSKGSWTHTGDFHATGTVTGDTDVVAAGISGKGHHHPGVQTGSGNTGLPAN